MAAVVYVEVGYSEELAQQGHKTPSQTLDHLSPVTFNILFLKHTPQYASAYRASATVNACLVPTHFNSSACCIFSRLWLKTSQSQSDKQRQHKERAYCSLASHHNSPSILHKY